MKPKLMLILKWFFIYCAQSAGPAFVLTFLFYIVRWLLILSMHQTIDISSDLNSILRLARILSPFIVSLALMQTILNVKKILGSNALPPAREPVERWNGKI
jgi:hypothetical protein